MYGYNAETLVRSSLHSASSDSPQHKQVRKQICEINPKKEDILLLLLFMVMKLEQLRHSMVNEKLEVVVRLSTLQNY